MTTALVIISTLGVLVLFLVAALKKGAVNSVRAKQAEDTLKEVIKIRKAGNDAEEDSDRVDDSDLDKRLHESGIIRKDG